MQPTFLPWAGYFNLLAKADEFVFLDDVQLEKQSWQTRNRILVNGQIHWVVVPVRHRELAQTIAETTLLDAAHWRRKFARTFEQSYCRHPHFADGRELIDTLLSCDTPYLAELNEALIRFAACKLGLSPRLYRARDLGIEGKRSERLAALCAHFGVGEYLSPMGAAEYLREDGFTENASARLRLQDYVPAPYAQRGTDEFFSHLSIVDVVANLGWAGARDYAIGHRN